MRLSLATSAIALTIALASCAAPKETLQETTPVAAEATTESPTVTEARAFMARAESELSDMSDEASLVFWAQATNITDETNAAAAEIGARATKLSVSLANESKKFNIDDLPQDLARKMTRLRAGITIPAPSTEGAAEELSTITTDLDAKYGTGTFNYKGKDMTLDELSTIIETSRDPEELKAVWEGWRTVSPAMKDEYARMVEIANEGAVELGYPSLDQMWLSNYDMAPEEMEAEVDRLWSQVEPLYKELHCYARTRLNAQYGDDVQPKTGPIRADLLGNMWAQDWSGIYDVVKTDTPGPSYNVTQRLVEKGYDPIKMVKTGEAFFTSLGFAPLPETFWERSMITRPEGKEVICHASAWDLDNKDDLRIKMCTEVKDGANDGFHEAIGDFIGLSITPEYLKQISLIDESEMPPADADTALLLNIALKKIAFLPFALTVDGWRWDVLSGKTAPADYNDAWWAKRLEMQGIVPPGPRPADAFDPGAKYHIPGNTPYLRYFLSYILQFQFHKAACEQAGWEGPLHRCSIYDNKEVGERFNAMLEMGASKPWPDALEAFTGTREIDGSAIVEYFDPLMVYLKEQNAGQSCGWDEPAGE